MGEQYHILDVDAEYVQPSREPYPRPARYYRLTGTATDPSKDYATVLSSLLLQDGRGHDKTSKFHVYRPIAILLLLYSEFCDEKPCCVKYLDDG